MRLDRYGGQFFENRTRFLLRVVKAVRAVWPERPLFMRRYGLGGGSGKGRRREVAAVGHRADLAGGRAEEAWRRLGRPQLRGQLSCTEDSHSAGLPGTPLPPSLSLSFVSVGPICGGGQEGAP